MEKLIVKRVNFSILLIQMVSELKIIYILVKYSKSPVGMKQYLHG